MSSLSTNSKTLKTTNAKVSFVCVSMRPEPVEPHI